MTTLTTIRNQPGSKTHTTKGAQMPSEQSKRKVYPTNYTKQGEGAWFHVYTPDTQFNTDGEFKVDLFLAPEDAKEIIDLYNKIVTETVELEGGTPSPDVQYRLVSEMTDKQMDSLTKSGYEPDPTWYRFCFRTDHHVKPRDKEEFYNKMIVVDKSGHPLVEDPDNKIGNGSKIRVAFQPYGWCHSGKTGCKMRLKGIQVIEHLGYSASGVAFTSMSEEEDIAF